MSVAVRRVMLTVYTLLRPLSRPLTPPLLRPPVCWQPRGGRVVVEKKQRRPTARNSARRSWRARGSEPNTYHVLLPRGLHADAALRHIGRRRQAGHHAYRRPTGDPRARVWRREDRCDDISGKTRADSEIHIFRFSIHQSSGELCPTFSNQRVYKITHRTARPPTSYPSSQPPPLLVLCRF